MIFSLLVRKINKAKWFQKNILEEDIVSADAITNCLKTSRNTLSVWKIESEQELDMAVLALASKQEHLDAIDVVILEESTVSSLKIEIIATPGDTPVSDLVDTHRDLSDLDYDKLGCISSHIVERVRADKLKRYTKSALKTLLKNAIEEGLLRSEDLQESVLKKM